MRITILISILVLSITSLAQTAEEWTQQKKTQIKYLLQQIAANKVYLEYVEKGYGIARNGLNTIQKSKRSDFNLHQEFIGSLAKVNSRIRSYSRVAEIISYQVRIVQNIGITISNLKESNRFSPEEFKYCKAVFNNLLGECLKNIDELYLVITAGNLDMNDDQRIKRIDKIWSEMQDKYSYCKAFSEECSVLAMQRANEQLEIEMSKRLNGIK